MCAAGREVVLWRSLYRPFAATPPFHGTGKSFAGSSVERMSLLAMCRYSVLLARVPRSRPQGGPRPGRRRPPLPNSCINPLHGPAGTPPTPSRLRPRHPHPTPISPLTLFARWACVRAPRPARHRQTGGLGGFCPGAATAAAGGRGDNDAGGGGGEWGEAGDAGGEARVAAAPAAGRGFRARGLRAAA